MDFSYNLIKEYITKLPKPDKLAELLTMHSFEVEDVQKRGNDYIFSIDILPNRMPDVSGHLGVAREIAALSNAKVKEPKIKKYKLQELNKKQLKIKIQAKDQVWRYFVILIKNVEVKESPLWLKKHLKSLGIKSINNVVDVTNFVMHEYGQPLHAFDYDKIKGKEIIIRKSRDGERLTTLDGVKRIFKKGVLVIADKERLIDLAGIMGGENSQVAEQTKNVLLQAANFTGDAIYESSKLVNYSTDAAKRYASGLDPNLAESAIYRTLDLLLKTGGGKAQGQLDIYSMPQFPRKIVLRPEKVNSVLGTSLSKEEIMKILKNLSFEVKKVRSPRKEIVVLAKKLIGAKYKYGASTTYDAPEMFDCSSLMLYLYRQIGVEIPRISIDQYLFGTHVNDKDLMPGDLVFSKGAKPHKRESIKEDIGHVGLYIGKERVIHASFKKNGLVQDSLTQFKKYYPYRGARRILDDKFKEHFVVTVPTVRRDLTIEEDLIEEVARAYGYKNIKPQKAVGEFLIKEDPKQFYLEKLKDASQAAGFSEVHTYSFVGDEELKFFNTVYKKDVLELQNPTRPEFKYMRPLLTPSILMGTKEATKHQKNIQFFEINKVYSYKNYKKDAPEIEKERAVFMLAREKDKDDLFFELKARVDAIFSQMGVVAWYDDEFKPDKFADVAYLLHPYRRAQIKIGNNILGVLGYVHPEVKKEFGLKDGCVVAELALSEMLKEIEREKEFRPVSKYPAVLRDLSLLVSEQTKVVEVMDVIENTAGELLVDTDLFDIYAGPELPESKKNFAFRLTFQSHDKTLSDSEVNKLMEKIIKALEQTDLEWEIRR